MCLFYIIGLSKEGEKMKQLAAGIMSGTSLDGIDIIIASIDKHGATFDVEVMKTYHEPYKQTLYHTLKRVLEKQTIDLETLTLLNREIADAYSKAVETACFQLAIKPSDLSFVASHGQTLYHISQKDKFKQAASLQLGDGSFMAQRLKTTVISNFRNADIAAGGEGAPLVPYTDYALFQSKDKTRAMLNIGGIANMTVLPKNAPTDQCFAFDTGPGNMMIDYAMKSLFNKQYDAGGKIAKEGTLNKALLDEVMRHEYFKARVPKSTGREMFGDHFTKTLLEKYQTLNAHDIIHTLTHITALSIAQAVKENSKDPIEELVVSGGGVHNAFLLDTIREYLQDVRVYPLEALGYDSDFKEALAFLILGFETLHHRPSNIKTATGAKNDVILGQIAFYR